MVKIEKDRGASYRPVQAASVTGLFPGFARPHFLPDHVDTNSWNTVYVQRVLEEEIVSFEPLVENFAPAFCRPNEGERVARPGEKPIYVYAFFIAQQTIPPANTLKI